MSDLIDDNFIIPALSSIAGITTPLSGQTYRNAPDIDISCYDVIIICLSGGKDSIACLLHLIDIGVDLSRVELWHHDVDGREGSTLMDWPFMADYNRKIASTFQIPLMFSWLQGARATILAATTLAGAASGGDLNHVVAGVLVGNLIYCSLACFLARRILPWSPGWDIKQTITYNLYMVIIYGVDDCVDFPWSTVNPRL